MKLSRRDLALIEEVRAIRSQARWIRTVLVLCMALGILAFFEGKFSADTFVYYLIACVWFAIVFPLRKLKLDQLDALLSRVKEDACCDTGELIEALGKK